MVDAAVARFGRLDVLVNSASIWLGTPWPDASEADWDLLNGVAAKGTFLCARAAAAAPRRRTATGPWSTSRICRRSCRSPAIIAHSAAKAAVLNLTYALAAEMAPAVRVNAIAPGRGAAAARLHARNRSTRLRR